MPLSPIWNSYTSFLIALAPAFRKTYGASSSCYTTPDLAVIALFNLRNYFYRYNYWLNNNTSYSHCQPMTYIANAYPIPFFFTYRSLIFWEWRHTQLQRLSPPFLPDPWLILLFKFIVQKSLGFQENFSQRYGLCSLPVRNEDAILEVQWLCSLKRMNARCEGQSRMVRSSYLQWHLLSHHIDHKLLTFKAVIMGLRWRGSLTCLNYWTQGSITCIKRLLKEVFPVMVKLLYSHKNSSSKILLLTLEYPKRTIIFKIVRELWISHTHTHLYTYIDTHPAMSTYTNLSRQSNTQYVFNIN